MRRGPNLTGGVLLDTRRHNEPPAPEAFVIFSLTGLEVSSRRRPAGSREPGSLVAHLDRQCAYHRILRSVFNSAPAGTTAVSRKRHSATKSFLASATIPIFRIRLLPEPNRRSYHFESSLSG